MALNDEDWICSHCSKTHFDLPLSFASDFPDRYANLSTDQRGIRAIIATDQCIIDQEDFYIRGCFEIPVRGSDESFIFGAWARLFENDYDEIDHFWNIEGKESKIGPCKARLGNNIHIYPAACDIRLEVRIRKVGLRPLFFSVHSDYPLTVDQISGISREQAQEFACLLLNLEKIRMTKQ